MSEHQSDINNPSPTPATPLPLWNCHKQVRAARILEIIQAPADEERVHAGGDWILVLDGGSRVRVGHDEFVNKFKPTVDWYYVEYDGGYRSCSPRKAFEDGYALAPGGVQVQSSEV